MSLRSGREHSSDPLSPLFNRYITELAQVRNQQRPTTDPDSERRFIPSHARLKYYDCFNQQQVNNIGQLFYLPAEPDFKDLTIWLRCDYTGNSLHDYSCFDNHAKQIGDPRLVEGLSYGQFGGNIALQMDGQEDYFIVPEGINGAGRITSLSSGFSVCSIIYPQALQNVFSQTPFFFRKVDDDAGNYGYSAQILEDGDIMFASKINGNLTRKETTGTPLGDPQAVFKDYLDSDYNPLDWNAGPPNYFVVPGWYIIWFLSDQASPPNVQIYVNGALQTLTNSSLDSTINAGGTEHSTIIGASKDGASHYFPGIYQEYRFMKRQVTSQEITNHNTNKFSISPIAYGQPFTVGSVVFSPIANAIYFNENNQYIDCGAQTSLWSQNLGKFSLRLKVNGQGFVDAGGFSTFLGCADDPGGGNTDAEMSAYFLEANTDVPTFNSIGVDITRDNYSTSIQRFSKIEVVSGTEYDFVIVYDNTQTGINCLHMYLDAVLQDNANDKSSGSYNGQVLDIDAATKMLIGKYQLSSTTGSAAIVREFEFWYNVALTQQNITDLKNGTGSPPAPGYRLKMDEGTGNPVDFISGTKTGVLNGGAMWTTY